MLNLTKIFLDRPLVANLLTVLILIAGLMSLFSLKKSTYPEVNFDVYVITTVYPGASPEEIETGRKGGFSLQQPGTKLIKDREGDFREVTVGDMTAGSKPTGIAGKIQDIYRTGDPTTIKQRVQDFLNQKDPTGELRQTAAEQQELAIKKDENRPLNVIVAGGRNYSDYKTEKKMKNI